MSNGTGLNLGGLKKPEETANEKPPAEETRGALEPQPENTPGTSQVAESQPEPAPQEFYFSSHPIVNYRLGEYVFDKGLLKFDNPKSAEKFRKILAAQPIVERNRIKELDVGAAEARVREVLAASPSTTKAIDSSTGDRAPDAAVGRGTLESFLK